jgi:hypothetical protein
MTLNLGNNNKEGEKIPLDSRDILNPGSLFQGSRGQGSGGRGHGSDSYTDEDELFS